jgi:hypothetical protein
MPIASTENLMRLIFAVLLLAAPAAAADLSGVVAETIHAGAYTYLRLDTAAGPRWAAVPEAKVAKGARVRVAGSVTMTDFESRLLKRRFDSVVFGSLEARGAAPAVVIPGHGKRSSLPDAGPVKVAKAEGPGAVTIGELLARKAELKGAEAAVRGKVVKLTPSVMDLNWIHLRDGSGELTVTTAAKVELGEIVTARGRVTLDKDLGGRYKFPVLLENAALSR